MHCCLGLLFRLAASDLWGATGSILGPLMFLIYINDMPSVAQNSTIALFADDAKGMRSINNVSDCHLFQKDIDALYNLSLTWDLNFHPSKCQIISVTCKRKPLKYGYKINGTSLIRTESVKDLGIEISNVLKWDNHITTRPTVSKCQHKLRMMKRGLCQWFPTWVRGPLRRPRKIIGGPPSPRGPRKY